MDNEQLYAEGEAAAAYADHLQSMAEIEQVKDAAVDLLEALKSLVDAVPCSNGRDWWPDELHDAYKEAEAAIEKATKKPV